MVKNKVMSDLRKIQLKCMDTSGIETEEATKMSLILPVISALGYDIFNTDEVKPECGATYSAFCTIIEALEQQDFDMIADANDKLTEARKGIRDYKSDMEELAEKYDVVITEE